MYTIVNTSNGNIETIDINGEEGSQIETRHRIVLKMQSRLPDKGKGTSLPQLQTEEGPSDATRNSNAKTETTTTEQTETATRATGDPKGYDASIPRNVEHATSSSQSTDWKSEQQRLAKEARRWCPFCNRKACFSNSRPFCSMWTNAVAGQRRPNSTAEVPHSNGQQFRHREFRSVQNHAERKSVDYRNSDQQNTR